MPTLLLAAPVAALLAWLALRSRRPKRERGGMLEGLDGAFVPGSTGSLTADVGEEEEPFKRRLLPEASGGELGGQYGPQTQEQAPSALSGGEGFTESPAATQTSLLYWSSSEPTGTVKIGSQTYFAGDPTGKATGPGFPSAQPEPSGPAIYQPGQVVQPAATVAE